MSEHPPAPVTTLFTDEAAARLEPAGPAADPLESNWAEGLREAARASGLPAPRTLWTRPAPAGQPEAVDATLLPPHEQQTDRNDVQAILAARGAPASPAAHAHADAVEAPEAWATAEDELARADTVVAYAVARPSAPPPPLAIATAPLAIALETLAMPADAAAAPQEAPEQVLLLEAADEIPAEAAEPATTEPAQLETAQSEPGVSALDAAAAAEAHQQVGGTLVEGGSGAASEPTPAGFEPSPNAAPSPVIAPPPPAEAVPAAGASAGPAEAADAWVQALAQAVATQDGSAPPLESAPLESAPLNSAVIESDPVESDPVAPAHPELAHRVELAPDVGLADSPWSEALPSGAAQLTAAPAARWVVPVPQATSTWSALGAFEAGALVAPGDEDLPVPVDPFEDDAIVFTQAPPIAGRAAGAGPALAGAPLDAGPLFAAGEHRVAVHTRTGSTRRGIVRDVDLGAPDFPLSPQGGGATEAVPLREVKAVFFMLAPGEKREGSGGPRVRVTFLDGRTIEGTRDGTDAPAGFFLVPADSARTNTRRIFIARAAAQEVREG